MSHAAGRMSRSADRAGHAAGRTGRAAEPLSPAGAPWQPGHAHSPRRAGPLLTELRRGAGLPAGAATLAVLLFAMFTKADEWLSDWTETTDMLRVAGLVLGAPLAAAVACWQGGRERRRRTEELLATVARPPLRQALLAAAPAVVWPVVGYLLTAVVCLAWTWQYAGGDGPHVSLIVADATGIGSLAALGFVVGRVVPWRLAPPVVALVMYNIELLLANQESGISWLSPGKEHISSWDRPVWWFGPVSMVWTAGLAAAALLAYAARRRARALALAPLAAAVTAAVLLAQTGDGLWRPDPASAALVCDEGTPRVCATRVHSRMLPDASRALAGLTAKLRGIPNAPARIVEAPVDSRASRTDAALTGWDMYFRRNRIAEPEMFAANAAIGVTEPYCPNVADADRYSDLNEAVADWLAPIPRPKNMPGDQTEPGYTRVLKRLKAMPDGERTRWLGGYFAATRSCHPERVTAP
ncbi:hypothetical protein SPAR_07092 [Streptomyces sparsogenes DSM 40356]|uniref:Uncharacterized protein n=2 Tax=Streptomyces sparsogenes TaxID=67365 RepID=A0A1R1SPG3_9ACTN|nr:hypothetical protein SPAR_07092 [Streptomyces sparsogenes DSM 40356]